MCMLLKTFYPRCPRHSLDDAADKKVYARLGPITRCNGKNCPFYEIDSHDRFSLKIADLRMPKNLEEFDDNEHCICGNCGDKEPAPRGDAEEDDDIGRFAIYEALHPKWKGDLRLQAVLTGLNPKERAKKEKAAKEEIIKEGTRIREKEDKSGKVPTREEVDPAGLIAHLAETLAKRTSWGARNHSGNAQFIHFSNVL